MTAWTRYLGSGTITIRQIVISFSLGMLATPAYFFGVLPFDVNGQPVPLKGIESGSATVALCLAVCQFLVVWKSCREADEDAAAATGMFTFTAGARLRETSVRLPGWSLPLAMVAPAAGFFCVMWLLDQQASEAGRLPFLSAGIIGVLAGAALAKATVKRRTRG